ncbi:MAG: sulfatase-like hydrolase/transferase [Planctomycetes bacterium]|nr:sulfatase-like hydrolase/transferase [Planctomycetota bacterium]
MKSRTFRNVVFLISDQHRRDASGCYGHPLVQTPNIDRLAAEGTRFTQTYAAAPICGPCRSALHTGRHVHRCGAITHGHMKEDMGLPMLGRLFREAGYATGAFGKMHVAGENEENDIGFDERALRIYTPMSNDYQHAIGLENFWKYCSYLPQYTPKNATPPRNNCNPTNAPIELADELILDYMVADLSNKFLEEHRDEPFFLWVGLEKPHNEMYAPQRFHDLYDPDSIELPANIWNSRLRLPDTICDNPTFPILTPEAYTDRELRCCMAAYYANVSYMDEQLGRVLDTIDRLGLSDDTLVVYSTDHGENLFNHNMVQKHCFFETAVGVPLIVRMPGVSEAGSVRTQLTSLLDLLPTFTEACGLPTPEGLDGCSLIPVISENQTLHEAVFSEYYEGGAPERMIRTGKWKYIHSHNDLHQLYDQEKDPEENINLIDDPDYASICTELDERVCRNWTLPDMSGIAKPRGDTRHGQKSYTGSP